MGEIIFTVPGQPVPKARHKAARRGKHIAMYTPEKTANYEGLVAHSAHFAMSGREMITGAVSVELDIRLEIPPSWSKKKQLLAITGKLAATKKSDIDNITKSIFDGMNGVVWRDDGQVVESTQKKRYAETPGVVVIVRELVELQVA
ncbi:MAG: RusA family crossover junction endodeoxyribonuclease [Gammaproteobacteria bacterium]|nr:MAG: RusA family crossover junction endodeoxyribonuclease [Gammaproteobacteria bacterium]